MNIESESEFKTYERDFILCLEKLEKANTKEEKIDVLEKIKNILDKHEKFNIIPDKVLLFKELSNCLNPDLHDDIHLKVLELYEHIYKKIGILTLSKDLPFYITGLFSLFPYASTITKDKILDMFRTYFIPLEKDILPCLCFIVASLLSCNDISESLEVDVFKLIDDLSTITGEEHIYHSLWKIINLVPCAREKSLIYLKRKLPDNCNDSLFIKKHISIYKIIPNSLISALSDKSINVLDNILDLLMEKFAIHKVKFDEKDTIDLISKVFQTLLFINENISNKVVEWILNDTNIANNKVINLISKSIKSLIQNDESYYSMKIIKSILNRKVDIMKTIICMQDILFEILFKYKVTNMSISDAIPYEELQEKLIYKSDIKDIIALFPDDIIMRELSRTYNKIISNMIDLEFKRYVDTIEYAFDFLLHNKEVEHYKSLIEVIIDSLNQFLVRNHIFELKRAIELIKKILSTVKLDKNAERYSITLIANIYQQYYTALINFFYSSQSWKEENINILNLSSSLLTLIYSHLSLTDIPEWFNELISLSMSNNNTISLISIRTIAILSTKSNVYEKLIEKYMSSFLNRCWNALGISKCLNILSYDVFMELNRNFGDFVEDFIVSIIRSDNTEEFKDNSKKFTCLWNIHCERIKKSNSHFNENSLTRNLTKVIFVMLDHLSDVNPYKRHYAKIWILNSVEDIDIIFNLFLSILLDEKTKKLNNVYIQEFECRVVIYVLKLIQSIINCEYMHSLWDRLQNIEVSEETKKMFYENNSIDNGANNEKESSLYHNINTYFDLIISIHHMLLNSQPGTNFSTIFKINHTLVQINSSRLLIDILNKVTIFPNRKIQTALIRTLSLDCLKYSISCNNLNLQINILLILNLLIRRIYESEHLQQIDQIDTKNNESLEFILNSTYFYDILSMGLLQDVIDYSIKYYWIDFIDKNIPFLNINMVFPIYLNYIIKTIREFKKAHVDVEKKRNYMIYLLNTLYNILSSQQFHIPHSLEIKTINITHHKRITKSSLISGLKSIFISPVNSTNNYNGKNYLEFLFQNLTLLIKHIIKLWEIERQYLNENNNTHRLNPSAIQNLIIHIFQILLNKYNQELILCILQHWSFSPFGDDDTNERFKINCVKILGNIDDNIPSYILRLLKAYHEEEQVHDSSSTSQKIYIHQNDSIFTDFLYFYTKFRSDDYISSYEVVKSYLRIIKECLKSYNPYAIINMFKTLDILVNSISESILSIHKIKRKLQSYFSRLTNSIVAIIDQNFIDKSESWKSKISYSTKKPENVGAILEDVDFMSSHLLLHSIHTAYNHFIPILSILFNNENEKGYPITHKLLFSIITFLEENKEKIEDESFKCCTDFIAILTTKLEHHYHFLSYRKDINLNILFINNNDFFLRMSISQLKELMKLIRIIYTSDLNDDTHPWNELLKSLNYKSYRNQLKIKNIKYIRDFIEKLPFFMKKMAYIILSCPKDEFLSYLPKIQERIIDIIKLIDDEEVTELEFRKVYKLVFICFRILILKFNETSLKHFWPVIVTEMLKMFYLFSDKEELIISSLKLLDLFNILDYEHFSLFEWIFINDYDYSVERNRIEAKYTPIIDQFLNKFNEYQGSETKEVVEMVNNISTIHPRTLHLKEGYLKIKLINLKNRIIEKRYSDKRQSKESIEYELLKDLKENEINYIITL